MQIVMISHDISLLILTEEYDDTLLVSARDKKLQQRISCLIKGGA